MFGLALITFFCITMLVFAKRLPENGKAITALTKLMHYLAFLALFLTLPVLAGAVVSLDSLANESDFIRIVHLLCAVAMVTYPVPVLSAIAQNLYHWLNRKMPQMKYTWGYLVVASLPLLQLTAPLLVYDTAKRVEKALIENVKPIAPAITNKA